MYEHIFTWPWMRTRDSLPGRQASLLGENMQKLCGAPQTGVTEYLCTTTLYASVSCDVLRSPCVPGLRKDRWATSNERLWNVRSEIHSHAWVMFRLHLPTAPCMIMSRIKRGISRYNLAIITERRNMFPCTVLSLLLMMAFPRMVLFNFLGRFSSL